ncbi:MAG: PIG-L family deacetylase [Chloroflexi bacterium]|nr:PIG-L family deacetylase [Chloroflexota bacterium]
MPRKRQPKPEAVQPKKVLVITAHPDDSEFGAAGTVALWSSQGWEVNYVVCTNGDKGSQDPKMTPKKLAKIREKEQRCAADVLGVKEVVFLGYGDGELEESRDFLRNVVRLIRRFRPDIVVTQDPYRRNAAHRDHRITGRVVLDAIFPYARDRLHFYELLRDEGLEPHKVREVYLTGAEDPDTFIDISPTWERKIAAIKCHHSQVGGRDEHFPQFMRQNAETLGKEKGIPLAEAFRRLEMRV